MTSRFYSIFSMDGKSPFFPFAGNFLLRDKIHSLFILRSVFFLFYQSCYGLFLFTYPISFSDRAFSAMGERGEPCYNMGMMKEPKS